jgi:hypothetical protein
LSWYCGSPTISEIKVKISRPACAATSSMDRWIGSYLPNIPGKLGC